MKSICLSNTTASLKAEKAIERLLEQHRIVTEARDAVINWGHGFD